VVLCGGALFGLAFCLFVLVVGLVVVFVCVAGSSVIFVRCSPLVGGLFSLFTDFGFVFFFVMLLLLKRLEIGSGYGYLLYGGWN